MRRIYQPWTTEDDEKILAMDAAGLAWQAIAEEFPERTPAALKTRLSQLRRGRSPSGKRQTWAPEEVRLLVHLREVERKTWVEINAVLGRKAPDACCNKYASLRRAAAPPTAAKFDGRSATRTREQAAFAARDARSAGGPISITAWVFGDPPPGRSALDQKRAGLAP